MFVKLFKIIIFIQYITQHQCITMSPLFGEIGGFFHLKKFSFLSL